MAVQGPSLNPFALKHLEARRPQGLGYYRGLNNIMGPKTLF